ncbi:TPA: hypothetical protein ACH3X3_010556 [Trebouxia sp. C0006]
MMKSFAVGIIAALCLLASARAQTASTTYNITLTGAQNSPPISDPTVGQAFLAISFNTDSNNITYQLFADNITEVMAAHIHISATVGANGSVSIPLYQAPFVGLPGSTSTGLLAASALMPAVFVGPYLEILPDYTNVNVSAVLTQYVQTGLAYAQIHTIPYPHGAIKGTFNSSSIISAPVPAVYGAALIDPFTGEEEAELPFALTNDPTVLNVTETEGVPEFLG